ncbi:MAG: c-type cytochrome [Acidobacteriaceae bacterium]
MVGLGFLAYFHPVQLGPIADPANTKFVPRPEWYYLPMFEWLKFWSSRMEVFAVILIPGILALLFFLMPFLDRKLERRPWRRPIPLLAVAIVLVGMIFLGFKSHLDDLRDHAVAVQLAFQEKQAEDYTRAPFKARMESASGAPVTSGPVSPLVAKGKEIFDSKGCSGCHGASGTGTGAAPSLVGITSKYPLPQLTDLVHHPNAKMLAGHMPSFDLSTAEMTALFSYLGSLGNSGGGAPSATPGGTPPAPAATATPAASAGKVSKGKQVTGKTAAKPASAAAAAGQEIFQAHSCASCHGPAGAGTARVPAMAGLIAKRSDAQLAKLIQAPDATMKAGGMPPLVASATEVSSVVAYLRSLGPGKSTQTKSKPQKTRAGPALSAAATAKAPPAKQEAAKSAATPTSSASSKQEAPAVNSETSAGRAIFVSNGCTACHGMNAQGTHFAPSLIDITKKYPPTQLTDLLHHPKKAMRAGGMPAVTVNDAQMKQLVAYLSSLGTAPAKESPAGDHGTQPAPGQRTAPATNSAATVTNTPKEVKVVPLSAEALRGKALFERHRCETCHGVDGLSGTVAAPGLAGMASVLPASVLDNLLQHHSTQMKNGNMPPTNMSASTRKAIIAYIRSMPSPPDTH